MDDGLAYPVHTRLLAQGADRSQHANQDSFSSPSQPASSASHNVVTAQGRMELAARQEAGAQHHHGIGSSSGRNLAATRLGIASPVQQASAGSQTASTAFRRLERRQLQLGSSLSIQPEVQHPLQRGSGTQSVWQQASVQEDYQGRSVALQAIAAGGLHTQAERQPDQLMAAFASTDMPDSAEHTGRQLQGAQLRPLPSMQHAAEEAWLPASESRQSTLAANARLARDSLPADIQRQRLSPCDMIVMPRIVPLPAIGTPIAASNAHALPAQSQPVLPADDLQTWYSPPSSPLAQSAALQAITACKQRNAATQTAQPAGAKRECVSCCDATAELVIIPCGHRALCK